jgi:hypothetical protein
MNMSLIVKKTTEITRFDYEDGSSCSYMKVDGKQVSPLSKNHYENYEQTLTEIHREAQWMDIYRLSKKSPGLQEAVDRAIMLFELQAQEQDRGLMWHPV